MSNVPSVPVTPAIPVAPLLAESVPGQEAVTYPVRAGFQYVVFRMAEPSKPNNGGTALVLVDDDDDLDGDLDLNEPDAGIDVGHNGYVGYASATDEFGGGGPIVFIDAEGMDLILKAEGGALVDLIVETLWGLVNDVDYSQAAATYRLLWDAADRELTIDGRGSAAAWSMAVWA